MIFVHILVYILYLKCKNIEYIAIKNKNRIIITIKVTKNKK